MPGGYPLPLSAREMMAEARAITGISIEDEDVREPLTVLVDSLNRESELHATGAEAMSAKLVRMLANRLRMQRDYAAHPEIAEQKVLAPIVVGGLGRTGSTKTQQLLAATGQFNWLSYWQVFNPSLWTGDRGESRQPRIDDAAAYLEWFDRASPETKLGHSFALHDPEEETYLVDHSFRSSGPVGWSPIPSYLAWWAGQDQRKQFVFLRDMLKYLQWQGIATEGKRWVLKSPIYSGLEAALFDVFPDATIVMTHRRPSECIASGIKLLEHFHKPFTDKKPDVDGFLPGQAGAIALHLAYRAASGGKGLIDVHLRELIASPVEVIRRILSQCGVPFGADAEARLIEWEANDPPNKHGAFRYDPADYGLTHAGIDSHFAAYISLLEERFPDAMKPSQQK